LSGRSMRLMQTTLMLAGACPCEQPTVMRLVVGYSGYMFLLYGGTGMLMERRGVSANGSEEAWQLILPNFENLFLEFVDLADW